MQKNKPLGSIPKILLFSIMLNIFSSTAEGDISVSPKYKESLNCLAKNIYFEARGEDYKEKIMVANVTINRVKDRKFPNTICTVVYQKKQFSWTKYKNHIKIEKYISKNRQELSAWNDSVEIAEMALNDSLKDYTEGATHYHNHNVRPAWAKKMRLVASTTGHKWYKILHKQ